MIWFTRSTGVTAMLAFVNDPLPFASVTSPPARVVLISTPPATPAAPPWMCAILIGVPAGKLLRFTTNVAVAAVMLFAESRVTSNVIVALPVPADSELVIGGTSLDVRRAAVNVGLARGDGEAVALPQPALDKPVSTTAARGRFYA